MWYNISEEREWIFVMKNIDYLIEMSKEFGANDLKNFADRIYDMLQNAEGTSLDIKVDRCRKCDSRQIAKFGKDKNGKQRYKCNSCGCTFTPTSFSAISHSHCSMNTWKIYIELLLAGTSLSKCAEKCHISVQTAFVWRHKILSVLQRDQDNRVMNGIVETDDMFISVSYKGNHKNSKKFVMPRKSYKRGTDNTGPSGQKVCVMCAVERKGHTYGEVLGIGQASEEMLSHAFKDRILEESIVVADKAHYIKKYFSSTNIELVQTAAHSNPKLASSPPEIKGVYHIQNVNNLHKRFRAFLKNYNGVATKYLNHYVGLYIWIENHKKLGNANLEQELYDTINSFNTYIPANYIFGLPELPSVA